MLLSSWITCCTRSASSAASSVGIESASSYEDTSIACVPDSAAPNACSVVWPRDLETEARQRRLGRDPGLATGIDQLDAKSQHQPGLLHSAAA